MRTRRRRTLPLGLIALVMLAAGCSGAQSHVRRDIAKRTWRTVNSKHFEITTDLSSAKLQGLVTELEQIWWALSDTSDLIVRKRARPTQTFRIVHLASCDDFRAVIWQKDIGGYVSQSKNFQEQRTIVSCETMSHRREVLIHELAHRFNTYMFSSLPVWLSEGLATYFQTLVVAGDEVRLGKLPAMDQWHWRRSRSGLPSLETLRGLNYKEFHRYKERLNYFAAWKAIYLLNNSSADYHQRFRRYLSELSQGTGNAAAWSGAFGGIDGKALEKEYAEVQNKRELRIFFAPYKMRNDVGAHTIRVLPLGERHEVWIELLMHKADNVADSAKRDALVDDIGRQIQVAEEEAPSWRGGDFWRATASYNLTEDGKLGAEPTRLLRSFSTAAPDKVNGKLGLVVAQLATIVPEDHLPSDIFLGLEAIEKDVNKLLAVASSPRELEVVGAYFAYRKQPMTALNFVQRALAQSPGCISCLDTLALTLFQLGRSQEAIAAQQRAVNLASEWLTPKEMQARLEYYQTTPTSLPSNAI